MYSYVVNKNVCIGLCGGMVLHGFLQAHNNDFYKLTEENNAVVFIRVQDISYVRVYNPAEAAKEAEAINNEVGSVDRYAPVRALTKEDHNEIYDIAIKRSNEIKRGEDYSMSIGDQNSTYNAPTFVRKTPK